MHVFYNLINNSLYWIDIRRKRAQSDRSYAHSGPDAIMIEEYGVDGIVVYDTGTGVSKSMEDILFEPLQSGKPLSEGRGMGLYIVRKLLESFGGEIELLDERNEYGNRYKFFACIQYLGGIVMGYKELLSSIDCKFVVIIEDDFKQIEYKKSEPYMILREWLSMIVVNIFLKSKLFHQYYMRFCRNFFLLFDKCFDKIGVWDDKIPMGISVVLFALIEGIDPELKRQIEEQYVLFEGETVQKNI